jgi:hypothetical protein
MIIAYFVVLVILALALVVLYQVRELYRDLTKEGEAAPNRKLSPQELMEREAFRAGQFLLVAEFLDGETRLIGNKPLNRAAAIRLATDINSLREEIGFVMKIDMIPVGEDPKVLPLHEVVQGVFDRKGPQA